LHTLKVNDGFHNMIAKYAINTAMKVKHSRTLESIYATPTLGSVLFAEVEALIVALGAMALT